MKILVTGSKGFIGSHLVNYLLKNGHEVKGIDRNNGFFEHLVPMNIDKIFKEFEPEVVIHLASNVSNDIDECFQDVGVAYGLLKKCKETGVKKFIFSSSVAVFGNSYPELEPINPYGLSKLQCEQWCNHFKKEGMNIVVLRFANVYGPNGRGVINQFIRKLKDKETLVMNNRGKQKRDFIWVDDIVKVIDMALSLRIVMPIDVSTGESHEIQTIVDLLIEKAGDFDVEHKNFPKEIGNSIVPNDYLSKFLGYSKFVSIREGIGKLWNQ